MIPKAVKPARQEGALRRVSVLEVVGGSVKVRDSGSGSTLLAAIPNHIEGATIHAGDTMLVYFDNGSATVVAGYSAAQNRPTQSGYYGSVTEQAIVGGQTIVGGAGISVRPVSASTVQISLAQPVDFAGIDLMGVPSIGFASGVSLTSSLSDAGNLYLTAGKFASALQTGNQGWWFGSDGSWRMLRRSSFGPGPDFTQERFHWHTKGGNPLFRADDEQVAIGVEGSDNQLTVSVANGLRIHGSSITVDTLDATAIGPSLSAYLASILPSHPISISVPDATPSPWSAGIADPSDPTAVQIANGIELWLRAGGYGNLPQDTRILHIGPDGFVYGMPGRQVQMDLNGNVVIPASLLVAGTLTVGQRIDVGIGTWGVDFSGVALSSNYGFVGMKTGDTWNWTTGSGTYQVWWDRRDGNLKTALGDIWFGAEGQTIYEENAAQMQDRRRIRWRNKSNGLLNMEFGTKGLGAGSWTVFRDDGWQPAGYIQIFDGYGIDILTTDTYIGMTVPAGGEHRFRVGERQVMTLDKDGGHFTLPFEVGPWTFQSNGFLGYNNGNPFTPLDIQRDGPQLTLRLNGEQYTNWQTSSYRTIWSTTGDMVLNPVTKVIKPASTLAVNLGSPDAKWLTIHAAELRIDTMVAQNVVSTIGGRVLVAPTTKLAFDVQPEDTYIYVAHNMLNNNDILRLEARGQVEFMRVTSGATGIGGSTPPPNSTRPFRANTSVGITLDSSTFNTAYYRMYQDWLLDNGFGVYLPQLARLTSKNIFSQYSGTTLGLTWSTTVQAEVKRMPRPMVFHYNNYYSETNPASVAFQINGVNYNQNTATLEQLTFVLGNIRTWLVSKGITTPYIMIDEPPPDTNQDWTQAIEDRIIKFCTAAMTAGWDVGVAIPSGSSWNYWKTRLSPSIWIFNAKYATTVYSVYGLPETEIWGYNRTGQINNVNTPTVGLADWMRTIGASGYLLWSMNDNTGTLPIVVETAGVLSITTAGTELLNELDNFYGMGEAQAEGTHYRYTVERNLDASGANLWLAGDAVVNTRQAGYGFIDLYAGYGVKSASEIGPAIVFNVRQSATYNDWVPYAALGRLDGLYDYASGGNTWGSVFGRLSGVNITIDTANGLRIRHGTTNKVTIDTIGNATFAGTISSAQGNIGGWTIAASTLTGANIILGSGGYVQAGSGNNVVRMDSADPTYRFWIGNATASQAPFRVTTTGYVTASSGMIGGWLLGAQNFNSNSGNTGMGAAGTYAFWAGGTSTFHVKHDGYIYAIFGTIGGWGLASSKLMGSGLDLDASTGSIQWGGNGTISVVGTNTIGVSKNFQVSSTFTSLGSATFYGATTMVLTCNANGQFNANANAVLGGSGYSLGFYGNSGATKQTVTGSRGGNAALASLLTALATLNLITNSTS